MLSQLLLKFSNSFEILIVEISVPLVYSVVFIQKCFTNDKFLIYTYIIKCVFVNVLIYIVVYIMLLF